MPSEQRKTKQNRTKQLGCGKNQTTGEPSKTDIQGTEREKLTQVLGAVYGDRGTDEIHIVALDERRVVHRVERLAGHRDVIFRVADLGAVSAGLDL